MNFSNIKDWTIPQGSVTRVTDSHGIVIWEKSGGHDYSQDYFFIEDISGQSNTVSIKKYVSGAPTITVYKSTDGTNWERIGNTSTTAITATIPANSKLYLKATANSWCRNYYYNNITASGNCNVGGNIMSLLYGDNFKNQIKFPSGSTDNFNFLFYNNTYLVNASNLALPATTLAMSCYKGMFRVCTSLATAPALPATTLVDSCYSQMFSYCSSLATAPTLPATTLAIGCYQYMFSECTSLTTAPALPVTTLADSCYSGMFKGCTSLTTAPVLPATTLADSCYADMFWGCTALTTAPALPATTLAMSCYKGMFRVCTSLATAPALPATTLVNECYSQMFIGCTSLATAPALPATILTYMCYEEMFSGCTSLTQAPTLPATRLTDFCYYRVFQGCSNLNRIVTYAQDISASNCLTDWLSGVSATGDFYNIGGATYPSGASGIPTGWTEHNSL